MKKWIETYSGLRVHYLSIFFLISNVFFTSAAYAVPQPVVVTFPLGQTSMLIDLKDSLGSTVLENIVVTLTPPMNGSTTPVGFPDFILTYTPDTGFSGTDTFTYGVTVGAGPEEFSTISIIVNNGDTNIDPADTANDGVKNALESTFQQSILNQTCLAIVEQGIRDLCESFQNATLAAVTEPDALNKFHHALHPTNVTVQGQMASSIAEQQTDNIIKRLSAVRRGSRGISLNGLAFNQHKQILPGSVLQSLLPTSLRGGAASADQALGSPLGVFANGYIGMGEQEGTDREDAYEFRSNGITFGADYRVNNNFVFGAALGYAVTGMDLAQDGGGLDVVGTNLSLYTSYYVTQSSYFDIVLMAHSQKFDMFRNIQFLNISTSADADTTSSLTGISIGGGIELSGGGSVSTELTGRIDYLQSVINEYEEVGAGGFNLLVYERDTTQATVSLGMQFSYAISKSWGVMLPQLDVSWEHDLDDTTNDVSAVFAVLPDSTPIRTKTNNPDNDYFKIGLGISTVFAGGNNLFIQVNSTVGKEYYSESKISAGIRMEI